MSKFKRIISLMLVFVFTFGCVTWAEEKNTVMVMKIGSSQAIINGQYTVIDKSDPAVSPVIVNETAYVPVEFINDHFNTTIDINTVKAMTIDNTVFVPLRGLAEGFGYSVYFRDGVIVISNDKSSKIPDTADIAAYSKSLHGLPVVGDQKNLNALLSDYLGSGNGYDMSINQFRGEIMVEEEAMEAPMAMAADSASHSKEAASATGGTEGGHSTTNTQVQGVDEGDIIKTDGKYIFFSPGYGDYVSITKATPANDLEQLSKIELGDYMISEMYLGKNQLIVLATGHENSGPVPAVTGKIAVDIAYPYYGGKQLSKVFVYDTSDMKNIKQVKSFEIDGSIHNSRKVDNVLYLITESYMAQKDEEFVLPVYTDSATGKKTSLTLDAMCYLPEALSANVTTITGIRLDQLNKEATMLSYLGNSETIYMSKDNLFITTSSYDYANNRPYASTTRTNIYKFALKSGQVDFTYRGRVDGSILNQFSMDEYQGYFRIATTTWTNRGDRTNNLFVLDGKMNKVGQLTNIAPNENIYSVRFLGDKAHMVTFEVVDPLFVIDLSTPTNPKILGELKIPGYSVYLHPYDENHLIGFGYDTVEIDGSANLRGLKISMFDISDLSNPKEKFTTIIGDRGTHSELLYNHKALLFDKEKDIFAFPIEIRTLTPAEKNDRWAYGKFAFQGAYVYSIDMEKGFVLSGSITNDDSAKEGNYNEYVQRILYIGDALYTASNESIVSTDMRSFQKLDKVSIN